MARLTVEPAAEYVGVSRSMLDKLRTAGGGPRFIKLGKKVLYDTLDLDRWCESNKQESTARLASRAPRSAASRWRIVNVLDLFSGIGGFSLGLERAGMRTVAFCEIDPFCRKILAKNFPGRPVCGRHPNPHAFHRPPTREWQPSEDC